MHKKLGQFKDRIKKLTGRGVQYELQDSGNGEEERSNSFGRMREQSRSTSFFASEQVIGLEDEFRTLLATVPDPDPRRSVISTYGMGGLGKTTLAMKLYNDPRVKQRFDCCVCVYVSQDYTTGDILLAIILSLGFDNIRTEDLGKINETSLANTLHKSLQQRSYFVVIDDVRDAKVWESLRRAFPDENGGRIIITTRIKEIVELSAERIPAHPLRFLTPDESWELFSVQVFRNCNPDEGLEKLGKEMVEKCLGLPVIIQVLGGILSRKEPHKWCEVSDSTQIHPVLSSSFDSLPRQLKLCFLYLSSFPEDLELKIEKLIHLLVVEAFIPQVKDYVH
ncbi:hypothetical protein ACOSQ4_019900 [Xanthoceras sorbifolium]